MLSKRWRLTFLSCRRATGCWRTYPRPLQQDQVFRLLKACMANAMIQEGAKSTVSIRTGR